MGEAFAVRISSYLAQRRFVPPAGGTSSGGRGVCGRLPQRPAKANADGPLQGSGSEDSENRRKIKIPAAEIAFA